MAFLALDVKPVPIKGIETARPGIIRARHAAEVRARANREAVAALPCSTLRHSPASVCHLGGALVCLARAACLGGELPDGAWAFSITATACASGLTPAPYALA